MRIGLMFGTTGGTPTLDDAIAQARQIEALGLDNQWLPHIFGLDAITTAAVVGREVDRIDFGTAVVPTYPRHPAAMAQQALTTQAAIGGRFTLGIGLSHKIVIEGMFGMSYEKPARHMREYLEVLTPLLRGEPAKHEGREYRVNAQLDVGGASTPGLVVAALGPVMLKLAGRYSDGTITWMTGPHTIESHIVPHLHKAAKEAGRPTPRVVCGLPIALTNDADAARQKVSKVFSVYGTLPSYRAMLDKEGAGGPENVAFIGDEATLRAKLERLRDIGVTDFDAAITPVDEGASERTLEFLASFR